MHSYMGKLEGVGKGRYWKPPLISTGSCINRAIKAKITQPP